MSSLVSRMSVGSNVAAGKFSSKVCLASESQSRANTTSIPASWKPRLAPPQPEKKSNTFTLGPGADSPFVSCLLGGFMDEVAR